jgi:hypothetical protein
MLILDKISVMSNEYINHLYDASRYVGTQAFYIQPLTGLPAYVAGSQHYPQSWTMNLATGKKYWICICTLLIGMMMSAKRIKMFDGIKRAD